MVINDCFDDLLQASSKWSNFSLPTCKESGLKIIFNENITDAPNNENEKTLLPFAASDVYEASLTSYRRLTAKDDKCKSVYEVTLNVQDSKFDFKAGDTIGVLPQNNKAEVIGLVSHLQLQPDVQYTLHLEPSIKGAKIPPHIPVQSTLRHVLTHCVDLRGVVKKLFLLALSKHTKDESERKLLEYLCSKEGAGAYTSHVLNQNLCLLDIFNIFHTCKPPIEVMLANLPRLLPRPYSIVNSGLKNNKEIRICFSVININSRRKGLTTGWLETEILNKELCGVEKAMQNLSIHTSGKNNQNKVPIYLRKNINSFALPDNFNIPLIMIGPGTGVAPFLGFLEERECLKKENCQDFGEALLFFGCRDPNLDNIYREELNHFLSKGTLSKVYSAFSRVENGGIKYVQDCIKQQGERIASLVAKGAAIFVCGDHKSMVSQVKDSFIMCLVHHGGMSRNEAEQSICRMEKEKRYIVDVWS